MSERATPGPLAGDSNSMARHYLERLRATDPTPAVLAAIEAAEAELDSVRHTVPSWSQCPTWDEYGCHCGAQQ